MEQGLTIHADGNGTPHTAGLPQPDASASTAERVLLAVRETAVAMPRPPTHIKVTAGDTTVELSWDTADATSTAHAPLSGPVPTTEPAGKGEAGTEERPGDIRYVGSPTVGVFYRAPEPGAPPFVAPGDTVREGQQVGIVEAMKLMIPVNAAEAGRVVELLVPNDTPVEFDEPLLSYVPAGAA